LEHSDKEDYVHEISKLLSDHGPLAVYVYTENVASFNQYSGGILTVVDSVPEVKFKVDEYGPNQALALVGQGYDDQ